MMSILSFFILIYFLNLLNKFVLQFFFQNFMLLGFLIFLINFPMNNLNFWLKIYYIMGIDYYSFNLIILSIWILFLMIMISENNLNNLNYLYYFYILIFLFMFLILCFMTLNLMGFYLFFEASLLPIFMLILGWGFQVDRIQAGMYMMLYTLIGSLPLLILISLVFFNKSSLMFNFICLKIYDIFIYIFLNMAFLIKVPMYFVHLWLPKAHVEAPLSGSMILAGVMLKLGSYGVLRFILVMLDLYQKYSKFFIIISLLGGIYSSLICLYQIDLKMLVAYSSIVHMSILMAGFFTLTNWGIYGGFMMMIAHGLCSSGLFCLVNISYMRFKTRSMLISKGLINYFPSLNLMWFLLCSSNLSFPPSLNLFSEIMLLNSLILWSLKLIFLLMLLIFFSVLYSLYLYSYSQHGGGAYKSIFEFKSIMVFEYMILILHWLPLNILFLLIYLYL